MSTKYSTWMLGAAIAILALPVYLRTAQTVPVAIGDAKQEDAVAVRMMFGLQRIHPKTWDGEMTLSRGKILRLKGVYFEHDDAILSAGRWKLTSRASVYMDSRSTRGYDPVHTKPWELIPNGIVATIQAPP